MEANDSILSEPARNPELGGDRTAVPARVTGLGLLARARASVWGPVVAKASAIFAGMLGLAAIGAWSTLAGAGVPVAISNPSPSSSGAWLAPERAAHEPVAPPAPAASGGTPPVAEPPAVPAAQAPAGMTSDGKVVLNLASAEELQKLPRVGAKRALAIIELRKKLGRFRQATDLLRVRGIGRKTLRLMLPVLVVDAPATTR